MSQLDINTLAARSGNVIHLSSHVSGSSVSTGSFGRVETDNLTVGGSQGSDGEVLTSTGTGVAWEAADGGISNVVEDTTPQLGGDLDGNNRKADNFKIVGFEGEYDNAELSLIAFYDINPNLGQHQKILVDTSVAVNLVNDPPVGKYTFRLVQDPIGSRVITWPEIIDWVGGAAPTLSTAGDSEDIIILYWTGMYWFGWAAAGAGASDDVQFDSFGVGTAASGTTGEIRAINDITAYYSSDVRLKKNIKPIDNALLRLDKINGYEFDWKKGRPKNIHSHEGHAIGVSAQEIMEVLPEVVQKRDNGYLAVDYQKIVALLINGIKELKTEIEEIKGGYSK